MNFADNSKSAVTETSAKAPQFPHLQNKTYLHKEIIPLKIFTKYFFSSLLLLLLVFAINLNGQNATTNKGNLSTIYFDTIIKPCGSQNAQYVGYIHSTAKKNKLQSLKRSGVKREWEYKPFNDSEIVSAPIPLNGELMHYTTNDFYREYDTYDLFKNGHQTIRKERVKNNFNKEIHIIYYDSLYKNMPATYLMHKKEKDTTIYKQYLYSFNAKPASEKIYLLSNKKYTSLNRPILGLYWNIGPEELMKNNSRAFIELGYSKKFVHGTYLYATKKRYADNATMYQAINVSLLGTARKDDVFLGQKITYSYTYHLLRAEGGLLNYTNLKNTDLRIVGGLGASVFGNFSIMGYYSLTVVGNEFTDLGRISFGVSFH